MRAVRIHSFGAPPVLDEIEPPTCRPGEVLVRVEAAMISHLDLTVASGTFGYRPALPYIGGVEGAGRIVESRLFQPGQQVLLRGGGFGLQRDGTWQEFLTIPESAVTLLEPALPPLVAASLFAPATTAYIAVHDLAQVRAGEHVAVIGAAGAVGAMAVQLAVRAGATVTGVVGRSEHLAALPEGVARVLMSDPDQAAELADSRSFDSLVDTVGGPDLIARTGWVRPGGRAVALGYTAGVQTTAHLPSWLLNDVALLPLNMIRRRDRSRQIAGELVGLIASGQLQLAVEGVAPEHAAEAAARLGAGEVTGRIAIAF